MRNLSLQNPSPKRENSYSFQCSIGMFCQKLNNIVRVFLTNTRLTINFRATTPYFVPLPNSNLKKPLEFNFSWTSFVFKELEVAFFSEYVDKTSFLMSVSMNRRHKLLRPAALQWRRRP